MPRRKRKWYPGAKYHIMTRGNRKALIFQNDDDYQMYINILKYVKRRHPFYLYAFCLMPNHVHLQIETIDTSISTIMMKINARYSRYYNSTYDLVGHTFQGRYHSILAETDGYMYMVNRYIHLNPVEAKLVLDPAVYPWCSFRAYLNRRSNSMVDWERFADIHKFSYADIVDIS